MRSCSNKDKGWILNYFLLIILWWVNSHNMRLYSWTKCGESNKAPSQCPAHVWDILWFHRSKVIQRWRTSIYAMLHFHPNTHEDTQANACTVTPLSQNTIKGIVWNNEISSQSAPGEGLLLQHLLKFRKSITVAAISWCATIIEEWSLYSRWILHTNMGKDNLSAYQAMLWQHHYKIGPHGP